MKRFFYISLLCLTGILPALAQQSEGMRKLSLADFAITHLYVDSVDESKLVEDAIRGMLEKLDPHSSYTTAEETKELTEPLQGNFSGIGIQFNVVKDTLVVVQTISGGPSEKVGILAGDRFIAVNDTVIAGKGMKNNDMMKMLRGETGTTVRISVARRGVATPIEFKIVRDRIPIHSIDAAYMIDKNTGYIRISRFAATTADEFEQALRRLNKKRMKNLIVDLQGNGGGYLNSAVSIADDFLSDGQDIVYTEGRRSPRDYARASRGGSFQRGKLAILVDENSASASEILSGAVQDWDRGVIIGRRTFGKGLVQRPIPFPDGSMMRLTVSRYYTPSGRSIQKPYSEGREEYHRDLLNRYNHGEYMSADSIHFADSLRYTTLKNKRTIYGGGGIMPDIFVPLDTTRYTDFHRDLAAKGILNFFPIAYLDAHRKELLAAYKDADSFIARYTVSDEMLDEMLKMAETERVKFDEAQYRISQPLIRLQLKAILARDLYDTDAYFRVMNPENGAYAKAVEILGNETEYNRLLGK